MLLAKAAFCQEFGHLILCADVCLCPLHAWPIQDSYWVLHFTLFNHSVLKTMETWSSTGQSKKYPSDKIKPNLKDSTMQRRENPTT